MLAMAKKKLRIGVLFGGKSGEHEVSLLSAASILKAIDRKRFDVVPMGITKDGQWIIAGGADGLLWGKGVGLAIAASASGKKNKKADAAASAIQLRANAELA